MNPEEKPTNENENNARAIDAGAGVSAALEKMSQPGYLNTMAAMGAFLTAFSGKVVEAMAQRDEMKVSDALKGDVERLAGILLGEDKAYHPLPGWNQPGGIDVWLRQQRAFDEGVTDPREVVESQLWCFVQEVIEAVNYAADPRTPESLAQSNAEILMHQYVYLLLGIPDLDLAAQDELPK